MAQSPFLVDQIQVEPATTGTRLLDRNPVDGSLRFTDPFVVASLLQMVGMRNITGVFVVGAGAGAAYTSIQDALDAVPDSSSPTSPSLILVGPGVYTENLVVEKDGVQIVGLGRPSITASSGATILIQSNPTTTPENVLVQAVQVVNTGVGGICIQVSGAGVYATGSLTLASAPVAGDTITIGGVVLTGVLGLRTAGANNFSVSGLTLDAVAAEIAIALSDPANGFTGVVVSSSSTTSVNFVSFVPGVAGDAVTLATTSAGITISGPNLTGGSAAGSTVGLGGILVQDCVVQATGVGGFQIQADTVNHIQVQGGTWSGSSSSSLTQVNQCASFGLFGLQWVNDLEVSYNTADPQPSVTTSEYLVAQCGRVGAVLQSNVGLGSLSLQSCPDVGAITSGGDGSLQCVLSKVGNLTLSSTLAASCENTTRGTATVASGTPTLSESSQKYSVVFAASSSEVLTFDVPQPDAAYTVLVDSPDVLGIPQATLKLAGSVTLATSTPITGTVQVTVLR